MMRREQLAGKFSRGQRDNSATREGGEGMEAFCGFAATRNFASPGNGICGILAGALVAEASQRQLVVRCNFTTTGRNATTGFFVPMHRIGDLSERNLFSTYGATNTLHALDFVPET